jgi:hypothetical protein
MHNKLPAGVVLRDLELRGTDAPGGGSKAQVKHLREFRFFFFWEPENSERGRTLMHKKHKQSARPLPLDLASFISTTSPLESVSSESSASVA